MSLLKYLSRVDPCYRDSQLPDPNGRLARAVPSSAISVANKSVNVCVYHETHCRCGSLERLAVGQMEPRNGAVKSL